MKTLTQLLLLLSISFIIFIGCDESAPNEPLIESNISTLNLIVDWTVTVEYPYEYNANLSSALSYHTANSTETTYLPTKYNGITKGWYQGNDKYYRGSNSNTFPSGISQFDSDPDVTITFDCPSVLIGPPYDRIGNQPIDNLISRNTTSCTFSIQLFWVHYNSHGDLINKLYPKYYSQIDTEIIADGQIHKHDSGSYGNRDFSIDLGVTGLTLNDLTITDDNINLMAGNLSINGSVLTGTMQYFK